MIESTHNNVIIPAPRMNKQPKLAIPLAEKIVPPLSYFASRAGSGLWSESSGSGTFISSGVPHDTGEGESEYYNSKTKVAKQKSKLARIEYKGKTQTDAPFQQVTIVSAHMYRTRSRDDGAKRSMDE